MQVQSSEPISASDEDILTVNALVRNTTMRQAADQLYIDQRTLRKHLKRIRRVYVAHNNYALVAKFVLLGYIKEIEN